MAIMGENNIERSFTERLQEQSKIDIDLKHSRKHQTARKELWMNVWIGLASSFNCTDPKTPTRWADNAVKDFDERFFNIEKFKP